MWDNRAPNSGQKEERAICPSAHLLLGAQASRMISIFVALKRKPLLAPVLPMSSATCLRGLTEAATPCFAHGAVATKQGGLGSGRHPPHMLQNPAHGEAGPAEHAPANALGISDHLGAWEHLAPTNSVPVPQPWEDSLILVTSTLLESSMLRLARLAWLARLARLASLTAQAS